MTQRHLEREDDAKPDRVPLVELHDGPEQRHKNQEDRDAVEEHANRDQEQDQKRQHAVLAKARVDDGARDRVDHAKRRERIGKDAGQRHHQQDDGRELARFAQDDKEVAQFDRVMDGHADKQAVEHGHHGGLGRCEPASAHAAQNQDRRGQAPTRFTQAAPERRTRQSGFERAHLVLARQQHGRHDQRQTGQDARNHAGGKQRRHRSARHQHRIDDEGHRWRNQDIGGRCRAHHAGRECRRVTGARHGRDHDGANRRRVGRAGTRNAAQEHGHQNGDQRQHARAAPDDGNGKIDQAQGHTGAVEDGAHQHKHRNRQQRVLAQTGIKILRHGQQAKPERIGIGQRNTGRARQTERRANRHAQQHHDNEGDEQQGRDHGNTLSRAGHGE